MDKDRIALCRQGIRESAYGIRQVSQIRSAFSLPGDQAACSVQLSAAPSTGSHAFCAMLPKPTTPMRNLVPTF